MRPTVPMTLAYYAVWIVGVGWFVDGCAGLTWNERLVNATWFSSEDAARSTADAGIGMQDHSGELYVIVTL